MDWRIQKVEKGFRAESEKFDELKDKSLSRLCRQIADVEEAKLKEDKERKNSRRKR